MDSKVWDQEYWLPATKHEKELEKNWLNLQSTVPRRSRIAS